MSIGEFDVDSLLLEEVPELRDIIRRHREDWPDSAMLYLLVARLFDLAVEAAQRNDDGGRDLVRRAYALTERMLREGTPSVIDCFSIEMIEPLMSDEYADVTFAMGPVAREDLASKLEWRRRYTAMSPARGCW